MTVPRREHHARVRQAQCGQFGSSDPTHAGKSLVAGSEVEGCAWSGLNNRLPSNR